MMSEDPLFLGGLDGNAIEVAVTTRPGKQKKESDASKLRADTAAKKEERLHTGKKESVPAVPAAPPPPEVDKSAMLDTIFNYRERFPELKSRNKCSTRSTVDELEDELHYIEKQLGGKDQNIGFTALLACMSGLEYVNPLGLNLRGLSKVTKDNHEEFEPILDELMIKYGIGMAMGPEMRLCMSIGMVVYTVHSANSGDPRVAEALARMNQKAVVTADDL